VDGKRKQRAAESEALQVVWRQGSATTMSKFLVSCQRSLLLADSSEQLLIGALEQKLVGIAGGHCHPDLARGDADLRADLEQA